MESNVKARMNNTAKNFTRKEIDKELKSETEYYHEIGTVIYKDIEDYWECRP